MIVRANGKSMVPGELAWDRRERLPTLPGLGYRIGADTLPAFGLFGLAGETEAEEEMTPISCVRVKVRALPPPCPVPDFVKLPELTSLLDFVDFAGDPDEATPLSQVRLKVVPREMTHASSLILPPRSRPATLLDGVDDSMCRKYREEAERILKSGLFDRDGTEELE